MFTFVLLFFLCLLFWLQAQAESHGHIRAVNSYAGFTEFDRKPAFLHPDSSKPTKKKSPETNSSSDILTLPLLQMVIICCVSAALTKKDRSRVSAEDILMHEDPRTAVLVRSVSKAKNKQKKHVCILNVSLFNDLPLFPQQERVQVKSAQASSL